MVNTYSANPKMPHVVKQSYSNILYSHISIYKVEELLFTNYSTDAKIRFYVFLQVNIDIKLCHMSLCK